MFLKQESLPLLQKFVNTKIFLTKYFNMKFPDLWYVGCKAWICAIHGLHYIAQSWDCASCRLHACGDHVKGCFLPHGKCCLMTKD